MKPHRIEFLFSLAFISLAGASLHAQLPPNPPPVYGRAAENRTYGQKLVNQAVAANPAVLHLGLHAVPPGETVEKIIACTDDTIGKPDSASDLTVPAKNQSIVIAGTLDGALRYKISTPLRDASGKIIGLAVFTFRRRPQNDPAEAGRCLTDAMRLAGELAQEIPSLADLFKPARL